jgi:hypothetical protein
VIAKGLKRKSEGKLELVNPKKQIAMVNHYESLALGGTASGMKNGMKIIYKNKLKVKNNRQEENIIYTERNCLVTNEVKEKSNNKTTVQYNLQN